jgi:hypothetical protein
MYPALEIDLRLDHVCAGQAQCVRALGAAFQLDMEAPTCTLHAERRSTALSLGRWAPVNDTVDCLASGDASDHPLTGSQGSARWCRDELDIAAAGQARRPSGVEFGNVGEVHVALPGPQRRLQRSFMSMPNHRQYASARIKRGGRPKPARHQQIPRTPLAQ